MYVVYDNGMNIVLPESIPNPDPYIWKPKPKILQCPENDLDGRHRIMLGRGSTSTRMMLQCVIYESDGGAINSSGSSVPTDAAAAYPCIPHNLPFIP